MTNSRHFAAIVLLTLCTASFAATTEPATAPATQPALSTPEAAVRTFLRAIVTNDSALGKSCTLSAAGDEILWQTPAGAHDLPADQKALMLASLDKIPLTRCKVGDTLHLAGNHSLALDDHYVNDNKQQIMTPGAPFPFDVERQPDGTWKIDPAPIIAARRAAANARQHPATHP